MHTFCMTPKEKRIAATYLEALVALDRTQPVCYDCCRDQNDLQPSYAGTWTSPRHGRGCEKCEHRGYLIPDVAAWLKASGLVADAVNAMTGTVALERRALIFGWVEARR